jgi:hypothetical protein
MTHEFELPAPRTTGANAAGPIPYIESVITGLGQVSIAVPIVFALAKMIRDLWRRARPTDPEVTDAQLIDLMEAQFKEIGVTADVEIARLKEELEE